MTEGALDKQYLILENKRLYPEALRESAGRKRLEEEIRRRNRELALLNRIITVCAASLAPESILDYIGRLRI